MSCELGYKKQGFNSCPLHKYSIETCLYENKLEPNFFKPGMLSENSSSIKSFPVSSKISYPIKKSLENRNFMQNKFYAKSLINNRSICGSIINFSAASLLLLTEII